MMELFKGTVTSRDWAAVGVILGVTVVVCAGFYFFGYAALQKELDQTIAEDQRVQADLKVARETQRNIEGLRAEAQKMEDMVGQFEERLPESREIPALLQKFEGLAREIGLRVKLVTLPRVTDDRKETIPFTVIAWGNFDKIARFINRLERFQRYLKVSDLSIGEEEEGVSEASFTLSTYRFIETEEGDAS